MIIIINYNHKYTHNYNYNLLLECNITIVMKSYDCLSSNAVDRFIEPFTECASVSDDKDRYYT